LFELISSGILDLEKNQTFIVPSRIHSHTKTPPFKLLKLAPKLLGGPSTTQPIVPLFPALQFVFSIFGMLFCVHPEDVCNVVITFD
jgi:hypothetical protein